MMKITGLSRLFKWENLHNWWLTKYFFAPLYQVTETGATSLSLVCDHGWLTVRSPFLTACWSLWFTEIISLH